jgi:hypothetical protein
MGVRRAEPAEEVYYVDAEAEKAAGDLPVVYLVQRDDKADASGPVTRGSFTPGRGFRSTILSAGWGDLVDERITTCRSDATLRTTSPVSC